MANPTKEIEKLDAELKALAEREEISRLLMAANSAREHADETLARARVVLDSAESALRFHERCIREVPDLIATVRFSPQRMLVLADGDTELSPDAEDRLYEYADTITDLRFFLETADERAPALRQRIANARKPIGALETAAKDAAREVTRLDDIATSMLEDAGRKLGWN